MLPVRILCDCPELAVECLQTAEQLGFEVAPEVVADPIAEASLQRMSEIIAIATVSAPSLERLIELSHRSMPMPPTPTRGGCVIALLERSRHADHLRDVAGDLGLTAVREVGPLIAALRLLASRIDQPWTASLRMLPEPDRTRLRDAQTQGARSGERFVTSRPSIVAIAPEDKPNVPIELGSAANVAEALIALRNTDRTSSRVEATVEGIDEKAVLEILFGPRRALSDPASKNALAPYGIPAPLEELCSSASRAAVEAGRIGFPVRISLASPDLRVWDHADLAVDMVDNAARVRDTFRQLMGLAKTRLSHAVPQAPQAADRLLGVMVTATSESIALLGVRAWPLPEGRVAMEIAFADAHGAAADDRTLLVMPAPAAHIERALRRLAGSSLVLGPRSAQRRAHLDAIADVLHRLSAFVHDRRREVSGCELRPLALLLDGSVEVREACVTVSDAFERMLAAPRAVPA